MHEGKHGILDDEKDMDDIFGKKKEPEHDKDKDKDKDHKNSPDQR